MKVNCSFQSIFPIALSIVFFTFSSCKKDDDTDPTKTPSVLLPWNQPFDKDSEAFFQAKINGTVVQYSGENSVTTGHTTSAGDMIHTSYTSSHGNDSSLVSTFISFGRLRTEFLPELVALRAYIKKGAYTYLIPETTATNTYNVDFVYYDNVEKKWTTYDGSGAQSNAAFTITDTIHTTFFDGIKGVKFRATFNCTLYSEDGASTITLTDGVYVGYLKEYN